MSRRANTPTGPATDLPLSPLLGYQWALALGVGMTALTLELLRAQLAAVRGTPMAPAGARLTIREIYDRMEAAGYHEISEIEWEDGHYEVEARDARGRAVELQVDGTSGAIQRIETQD